VSSCRYGREEAHLRLEELNAKPMPLSDAETVERYQVKELTFLCHYAATPCGWVAPPRPCTCECHTGMAAHVGPCKCSSDGGLYTLRVQDGYERNVDELKRILGRE